MTFVLAFLAGLLAMLTIGCLVACVLFVLSFVSVACAGAYMTYRRDRSACDAEVESILREARLLCQKPVPNEIQP